MNHKTMRTAILSAIFLFSANLYLQAQETPNIPYLVFEDGKVVVKFASSLEEVPR